MANWAEIPDDIIDNFVNRFTCVDDFVRFGAVCKSWRSVATRKKHQCFAPWLILTKRDNDGDGDDDIRGGGGGGGIVRTFFSLSDDEGNKIFHLPLPQLQGRRCWGTPYGWLITVGLDFNIHLINPLSQTQISLPSQPTFREAEDFNSKVTPQLVCGVFVKKFALAPHSRLVMAIYGPYSELAIAAPGDEAWTCVEISKNFPNKDIIFFNGQFYAVSNTGDLRICELNTTPPTVTDIAGPPDIDRKTNMFYLMEMDGELHFVERVVLESDDDTCWDDYHFNVDFFQVFKFDFLTREWSEVYDLGDHALFVGNNSSFAISTHVYSEFQPNCIYFTDDHYSVYRNPFCDMGVYDYELETVETFDTGLGDDVLSQFSRPAFFMPCL